MITISIKLFDDNDTQEFIFLYFLELRSITKDNLVYITVKLLLSQFFSYCMKQQIFFFITDLYFICNSMIFKRARNIEKKNSLVIIRV